MATYYVRPGGSNSNTGLGPSTALAWLTIAKALHAGSPVVGGDTVYVAPGTYREIATVAITPASELLVIGDFAAAQFSDLDGGEVRWTAYLTSDTAAPSGSPTLTITSKDFMTFRGFVIVGGTSSTGGCVYSASDSSNIKFQQCAFLPGRIANGGFTVSMLANTVDTAANWTFERNVFYAIPNGTCLNLTLSSSATAEYDANVLIRNNLFYPGGGGASGAIVLAKAGANTFPAGGLQVDHNTSVGGQTFGSFTFTTARNWRYPVIVTHNVTHSTTVGLLGSAGGEGAVVEDFNALLAFTPRTNVLTGGASVTTSVYAPLYALGQEWLFGMRARPPWSPAAGSPLLNANNSRLTHGVAGTAADDALVGTTTWTTPGNTVGSDDARAVATAIPATTGISQYLKLTNFGFAVPSDATVEGVRVDWERSASAGTAIATNSIRLVKAGTIAGTETVGSDTTQWTTTDVTFTHGGYNTLWGTTWTPAEVNASGFGVAISAKNTSAGAQDGRIDFVRVIVYYRTLAGDGITSVDLLNNPRPQGTAQNGALGALERGNAATKNLATYHTAAPGATLTGYGFQDFQVPVADASTELAAWVSYNASYSGSLPQLHVLNGEECGVAAASVTMAAAADTWEQLTLTVTPTRAGIVTLRVLSRSGAAAGAVTFDDFTIT